MKTIDISNYRKKQKAPVQGKQNEFSLKELLSKDIRFGGSGLSDQKKEYLFFELSTLLRSGIDLLNSLDLVTMESLKDKSLRICKEIKTKVIEGQSLSSALKFTAKFSDYDYFSVQIGEETGTIAEVLNDLALYYKRKVEQRRKIIGALTYPAIVLCTSAGAVFFMLRFVVPMFNDVFKRFGGKLPWMTEMVIKGSRLTGALLVPGIIFIIGMIYFILTNRKNEQFRRITSKLIMKIHLIGEMVLKIYLARFCNTMRLLISTKIPLLRAIMMSGQTIDFYPMEVSLKRVEELIMQGKPLYASLQEFNIYPPKMIQLIKVGEEINKLDVFFGNIANQYVQEIEYQTGTLSKVIEPIIIIFLGLVIGFILISMYLPMFQMSNSF